MRCGNCRSAIASRRYVYGQGALRGIAPLCDTCATALSAIGMDIRPGDREADTRPEWMRRLRAKDFTGSVA